MPKKKSITVFTNGTFEILHMGHIYSFIKSKELGTKLIVGLNSDKSFKNIKHRKPYRSEEERQFILHNIKSIDEVFIFDEDTPYNLIQNIKPDIITKGNDWKNKLQAEKELIKQWKGKLVLIPRFKNYSTTNLIDNIITNQKKSINKYINEHISTVSEIDFEKIDRVSKLIYDQIKNKNNKLIIFGNGGSAADSQHIAAEFVGIGLPAISLTSPANITAIGNDFSFMSIFEHQLKSLLSPNDIIIALSTSGRSANVINALLYAQSINCIKIGITGINTHFNNKCNILFQIKSDKTEIIQESYMIIMHMIYNKIKDLIKG